MGAATGLYEGADFCYIHTQVSKEILPTVKETTKTAAQKPVQKAAKKATMDDVWAAIEATNKQLKETSRIVGDLGNRFGDIAEHFLTPGLRQKFEKFGFSFGEISRNVEWENKSHNLSMELDALLENGTQAMVVEVKAKLDKTDIDEQIDRMEKVRRYAGLRGDTRQFYCAMATMAAKKTVIEYTLAKGFYLIIPSGEDVKVTKPTSEPRVW
jgi:hypothetical protein